MSHIQLELIVIKKEYLTPHYIRITLTGEGVEAIANTTVGIHNKILIPPRGLNKVYFPQFDDDKKQWIHPEVHLRPSIRTYTHRGIDLEKKEIWIDFVAHGDEGPASAWAMTAKPGDILGVMMKERKSQLYTQADHYILIADATGIPVIGAILEDLPAYAKGDCIIEVHSKEDEQHLQTKANIRFHWLHNSKPQGGSLLPDLVKQLELPENNRYAHIVAESSSVKEIREYLRKEKNWEREEFAAFSYWKSGVSEDKSTSERIQEN